MIQRDHGVYKPTTTEPPMRERIARALATQIDCETEWDTLTLAQENWIFELADAVLDAMRGEVERLTRERDEAREYLEEKNRANRRMAVKVINAIGRDRAAEQKIEKLREALTPFAEEAKFCDEQTEALGAAPINDDDSIDVSVGDLRRARAVLQETEQ